MTEKALYEKLLNILETIDREKYTDIVSIIECNIEDDGTVYMDAFDFACELHYADASEVLPKEVAELMIEIYLEEIAEENPDAMTNLGSLYYTGRCGEQNYEKAVEYYTMADRLGERQATENLGYCYYYGRTGDVDYKKAYHYFVKGALDNHLNSLYKIGDMYKNGYYVEKDEKEAFYIDFESGEYTVMTDGNVLCCYVTNQKQNGLTHIIKNGDAYGFELGLISSQVRDAMSKKGFKATERDADKSELFFLPGSANMNMTVLEYKFDENTVLFVFEDSALSATVIYK